MKTRLAIAGALCAALFCLVPALAWAQLGPSPGNITTPQATDFVPLYGRGTTGPLFGTVGQFTASFLNQANIWAQPQSFIGANVNPILADGAQVVVQNSATTAAQVKALSRNLYDVERAVLNIPPGSFGAGNPGLLQGNVFGGYLLNNNGSGTPVTGNGVVYYAVDACVVSGSNCWGNNYRLFDSLTGTTTGLTGVILIGSEIDYAVYNTATVIQGVGLNITASTVQPSFAGGFSCTGNSTARFTFCFTSLDNSGVTAFYAGTAGPAGANVSSQTATFALYNSGSVERFIQVSGLPIGTNSALSILDSALANGLYLQTAATGNPPLIATQGSDTNIGLVLTPKGTGALTLGTGSTTITAAVPMSFSSTLNGNTLPGGSDTIALLAASQTFTNKTLTSPTLGGTVTGPDAATWTSAGFSALLATGAIRSNTGFNINGAAGVSQTCTVNTASPLTLIFTNGILTGGTCNI